MEICIVSGARPNFIKVAPLIRQIDNLRREGSPISYSLVYTGCQGDPTLEGTLFDDLSIHMPDEYLGVDCENLNELTGQVMSRFEVYLQQHPTNAVVVVDDLASTMAALLCVKTRKGDMKYYSQYRIHDLFELQEPLSGLSSLVCMRKQVFAKRYVGNSPLSAKK